MASVVAGTGAARERRRYPRINIIESQLLTVDFLLGRADRSCQQQRGIVLDLSEGGIAVQPYVPFTPGAVGELRLDLPGAALPFAGTGMVAWVGRSGRAGLRFLNPTAEAREQLRAWLNREARAGCDPEAPQNNGSRTSAGNLVGTQDFDFETALHLLAERVQAISGASGSAIALGDSSGMVCRASCGSAPDIGVDVRPDSGLSGYCLRTGEMVHCVDTQADRRVDAAAARQLNLGSVVVVPVFAAGQLSGLLEVLSPHPRAFDERQVARLKRFAELLGATVEEHERRRTPLSRLLEESGTAQPQSVLISTEPATPAVGTEARSAEHPVASAQPASPPAPLFVPEEVIGVPGNIQPVNAATVAISAAPASPVSAPAPICPETAVTTPPTDAWETAVQACDACGHTNPPGIIDCEKCDVPLPAALLLDREEKTAAAEPSVDVAPSQDSSFEIRRSLFQQDPAPMRNSRFVSRQTAIILVVLLGGLGAAGAGWYAGHRRVSYPSQALPPSPPLSTTAARPVLSSDPSLPLMQFGAPASAIGSIPDSGPSKPSAASSPAAVKGKSDLPVAKRRGVKGSSPAAERGADQPEITIVQTSLSVLNPPQGTIDRSAQLTPGKLVHRVEPLYPASVRVSGAGGKVVVTATVTKKGMMDDLKAISGPELLREAALNAVRQWRYEPYQLNGQPVDVETTITFNFARQ